MEQHHRDIIKNNLPDLVSATKDVLDVVRRLMELNIINKWMAEYIKNPIDESSKKKRLYELIQGRGPRAFSVLCKVLGETTGSLNIENTNIRARNILLSTKNFNSEYNSNDVLSTAIRSLDLNNVDIIKNDEPYVKIHPDHRRMDVNDENLPTGVYTMGSRPKGRALILNINKIVTKDERKGSDVDVQNLTKLFDGLGYVVVTEIDSTKEEIEKIIKDFSNKNVHEKSDSIVVFIMSHGEAGEDSTRSSDILSSDGLKINTDWIIEQFGPHNISKNIPKLFFIQACRGKNSDYGWKLSGSENSRLQNDSTNSSIGIIVNRRYENVFIAYATVPGYNAKRDEIAGSWFVQKLCEVFRKNAWQFDLNTMMKMVDTEIKKLNSVEHGFQTVEWTNRGFNKMFYFNPGLYNDNSDDNNSKTTSLNLTTNLK